MDPTAHNCKYRRVDIIRAALKGRGVEPNRIEEYIHFMRNSLFGREAFAVWNRRLAEDEMMLLNILLQTKNLQYCEDTLEAIEVGLKFSYGFPECAFPKRGGEIGGDR